MKERYVISAVCKQAKVSRSTVKRWERLGLIKPSRVINPISKMNDRFYDDSHLAKIKWIKLLGVKKRTNDLYLKLLIEYIDTGKIPAQDLNWPIK
jgi:DNA-binding transcriptional MerR regulator